ncbi:MAG: methyltransferase domain-containing protein [Opitutaceae bacterium]
MNADQLARKFGRRLAGGGWRWLFSAALDRIAPARPALRCAALAATANRRGLEIGGPSRVFSTRGMLPVYGCAARIDNVNFSAATAWEAGLRDGGEFRFHPQRPAGTQWLREATALSGLADNTYDFLLSSHCLEHVANPLAALHEWRRVTRAGGHLVLVLPDPTQTFDHRRPLTTLAHLRNDFARCGAEDDSTHAAEALALHDVSRDPGVGSVDEFRTRVADNAQNRCLHHHIFDLALMQATLRETGWRVLAAEAARPMHLIAFAQKEAA